MAFIEDLQGDDRLLDAEEAPLAETDLPEHHLHQISPHAPLFDKIRILTRNVIPDDEKIGPQDATDRLIERFYETMNWKEYPTLERTDRKRKKYQFKNINLDTGRFDIQAADVRIEEKLKNAVFTPEAEKEFSLPEYDVSERRLKKMRKKQRTATTGPKWFNMTAPEITEELKNDLEILKMRSALDPKRFYKKNDMKNAPKYFQVGTVVDSATEHPNERLAKRDRKRTMADELLADVEFTGYNRKKFAIAAKEKKKSDYKNFIKEKRKKNKRAKKQQKIKKSAFKVKNIKNTQ